MPSTQNIHFLLNSLLKQDNLNSTDPLHNLRYQQKYFPTTYITTASSLRDYFSQHSVVHKRAISFLPRLGAPNSFYNSKYKCSENYVHFKSDCLCNYMINYIRHRARLPLKIKQQMLISHNNFIRICLQKNAGS